MKQLTSLIVTIALVFSVSVIALTPDVAAQVTVDPCTLDASSSLCQGRNTNVNSILRTIINVLLFIIAAVSVIVIIIGGIMYSTSTGDAGRTKKAKDTILYAVIGLVVAIFAFAIVNWVVGELT